MTDNSTREPAAFATFLMRWNSELLALYSKRMQEYAILPGSLMLCCSPDDVADLQDKFTTSLKGDYASAADKLTRLACGGSVGHESGDSYAGIILAAQEDARAILDQAKAQARRIIDEAESRTRARAAETRESAAA